MHDGEGNIRRHQRFDGNVTGQIMWQDRAGLDKWSTATFIDISESGVRFAMPERVELRSVVSVSCTAVRLHGQGTVRFCRREGNKYLVGVEFVGGFSWTPCPDAAPART
jgi:hypothetical protein